MKTTVDKITYVAKKDIPFATNPIKKGDLVDSTHRYAHLLDLTNKDYFDIYREPIYHKGQRLLYKEYSNLSYEMYFVDEINGNGNYNYIIMNVANVGKLFNITDKTKGVLIPHFFYFVNSDGKICEDYEERKQLNKDGLTYKKMTGNYFLTADAAREYRDKNLKKYN